MKQTVFGAIALAFLAGLGQRAYADEHAVTGHVTNLYADLNDFVIQADVNGNCGSNFFHIQRSRANFKEMIAVALTAFSMGKSIWLVVDGCGPSGYGSDRNALAHDAVFGP